MYESSHFMHWFSHSCIHLSKDLLTASSLPHLTPAYHSGKPLTSETRLGQVLYPPEAPHTSPSAELLHLAAVG